MEKQPPKNNVISGPWGERIAQQKNAEGKEMSLEKARHIISRATGLSEEFLILCVTAGNSRPSDESIAKQQEAISSWTTEEVVSFANKESNYTLLLQKPALVLAIYNILNKK